jgi:single stranded DNA-binding protein
LATSDKTRKSRNYATGLWSLSRLRQTNLKVSGVWKERTEWHTLVAFQRNAEILRDYVRKGSKILIQGKIRTDSWDDRETGERKYRTKVIVLELTLLCRLHRPVTSKLADTQRTRTHPFQDMCSMFMESLPARISRSKMAVISRPIRNISRQTLRHVGRFFVSYWRKWEYDSDYGDSTKSETCGHGGTADGSLQFERGESRSPLC